MLLPDCVGTVACSKVFVAGTCDKGTYETCFVTIDSALCNHVAAYTIVRYLLLVDDVSSSKLPHIRSIRGPGGANSALIFLPDSKVQFS